MPALAQRTFEDARVPRGLSDWALDAAFELDEALKNRAADRDVVDGFFKAFEAAQPYRTEGGRPKLVDATARDRLRGALSHILPTAGDDELDDQRIQSEVLRLTDKQFRKRLLASLHRDLPSKIAVRDRENVEFLRKFMLQLHERLIADRVSAAVYWRDRQYK